MTHEQDLGALARSIIDSNHYMTVGTARREWTGVDVTRAARLGGVSPAAGMRFHVSADAIVLTNVANIIHSGYVFHPSAGPVWALHTFYLVTMALMLTWYLRYARHAKSGCTARPPPRQQERWPVLPTRRFRLLSGLLRPASAMGTGLTRRPQRPRSRRRPPTNRPEPQE